MSLYTDFVGISADDILRRVEKTLSEEGGARVIHDLLENLAGEMEEMSREEHSLRAELIGGLSGAMGDDVPDVVVTSGGPPDIIERLEQAGLIDLASGPLPEDAIRIWNRMAPKVFALRKKINATDELISDIVERIYGIPRIRR